jgi:hypothetical protein
MGGNMSQFRRGDQAMKFQINDGGRAAAGYKGKAGDCVTRSIAIVTEKPYQEVYDGLNLMAQGERTGSRKRRKSNARSGVYRGTVRKYLEGLGWTWVPTMFIGQGTKVHLRAEELPSGRLIVAVTRHLTAVIDGVIHDTHNPDRDGMRCVYGYFWKCDIQKSLKETLETLKESLGEKMLNNIEPGQHVWIGGRRSRHDKAKLLIREVLRVSRTMVTLSDKCKYYRMDGSQVGYRSGSGITGIATPAEVTAWTREQDRLRQEAADKERKQDAEADKARELALLFIGRASVGSDGEGSFAVVFNGLGADAVRALALQPGAGAEITGSQFDLWWRDQDFTEPKDHRALSAIARAFAAYALAGIKPMTRKLWLALLSIDNMKAPSLSKCLRNGRYDYEAMKAEELIEAIAECKAGTGEVLK